MPSRVAVPLPPPNRWGIDWVDLLPDDVLTITDQDGLRHANGCRHGQGIVAHDPTSTWLADAASCCATFEAMWPNVARNGSPHGPLAAADQIVEIVEQLADHQPHGPIGLTGDTHELYVQLATIDNLLLTMVRDGAPDELTERVRTITEPALSHFRDVAGRTIAWRAVCAATLDVGTRHTLVAATADTLFGTPHDGGHDVAGHGPSRWDPHTRTRTAVVALLVDEALERMQGAGFKAPGRHLPFGFRVEEQLAGCDLPTVDPDHAAATIVGLFDEHVAGPASQLPDTWLVTGLASSTETVAHLLTLGHVTVGTHTDRAALQLVPEPVGRLTREHTPGICHGPAPRWLIRMPPADRDDLLQVAARMLPDDFDESDDVEDLLDTARSTLTAGAVRHVRHPHAPSRSAT